MKKLCVIFGGDSCEHDISIITAMQLKKNYNRDLEMLYLGLDNKFYLTTKVENLSAFAKGVSKFKQVFIYGNSVYSNGLRLRKLFDIDCVINCCHGGVGENGALSGYLELNKIKQIGSSVLPSSIAMDKNMCKQIVSEFVPVVKGILVKKSNFYEKIKQIDENFSNFLIVKPNSLGSSIGVKCCDKTNYQQHIRAIFEMGDHALVEERVCEIVEYNQACFRDGDKLILSAIEQPLTKSEYLTFEDKYEKSGKGKGNDRIIPAEIDAELNAKINEYTKKIYTTLGFNSVVRVDYIFNKSTGVLYFNEVNTIPGSMAFYLYEPLGIDYISLIDTLIENSCELKFQPRFNTDILIKKEL